MNARKRRKISWLVSLFPFRGIYGWSPRQSSQNFVEETFRLDFKKMGETLFPSL
jgi:hypothetical protein